MLWANLRVLYLNLAPRLCPYNQSHSLGEVVSVAGLEAERSDFKFLLCPEAHRLTLSQSISVELNQLAGCSEEKLGTSRPCKKQNNFNPEE